MIKAEEEEKTYYSELWKRRLSWTGHYIPIRVEKYGLYLEAYILSPPKALDEPWKQYIPVKIAYLPTLVADSIYVPLTDIYPSARLIKELDNKTGKLISAKVVDSDEFEPIPKRITKPSLSALERRFPKHTWTLCELASLFGKPLKGVVNVYTKSKDISHVGEKYCLICSRKNIAYRIGKVIKLAEKSDPSVFESIDSLTKEYEACELCEFGTSRKSRGAHLVFGRGDVNPAGMIIAESPWEQEERDKIPLHPNAPAGKVLHRIMGNVGLNQADGWYLTNSTICRPMIVPGGTASQNKPAKKHIRACSTRLKRTLRSLSPKLIVLLGSTSYEAWFGHAPQGGVKRNLGWVSTTNEKTGKVVNYHVFFTYHPSYLARQSASPSYRELQKLYLEHWRMIAKKYEELK